MGRKRIPLPGVPLFSLSRQQQMVYKLAASHSTQEIARIMSIPEKQVRQVYTAIRKKSKVFANKKGPENGGTEYALLCRQEMSGTKTDISLSRSELLLLGHLRSGCSVRDIPALLGRSANAVGKLSRKVKKKLGTEFSYPGNHNSTTNIDTGKTQLSVKFDLIRQAMQKLNYTPAMLEARTGVTAERLHEMEKQSFMTYDEMFRLGGVLGINPHGPCEKDQLEKKMRDRPWLRIVVAGSLTKNTVKDRTRFRNKVMYYGMASYRYNHSDPSNPIIEEGRNGYFPLVLNKAQLKECMWLIKRFRIRTAYCFRGCDHGMNDAKDAEEGAKVFIVNKEQFEAIRKSLYG